MANNTKHTVLFVDDEPRVTGALKAIFRRDYNVLTADSGAEALRVLAQTKVDVVVSDQRMPEMLGNELLAAVSHQHPQTMRILLTGFMDRQAIVDSINEGEIYRFINKPWKNDEIRQVVADAALASEIPFNPEQDEASDNDASSLTQATAYAGKPANDESIKPTSSIAKAMLMIEKQQDIRHQIRKFCQDQDIMIYGTQNVEQALIAATTREGLGVAVIELSEDMENAVQTINLLKQAKPELIAIVLTDEYDAQTAVDLINQGQVFKYLAKPLNVNDFQNTIQIAFNRHRYLKQNKRISRRYQVEKPAQGFSEKLQGFFSRLASA